MKRGQRAQRSGCAVSVIVTCRPLDLTPSTCACDLCVPDTSSSGHLNPFPKQRKLISVVVSPLITDTDIQDVGMRGDYKVENRIYSSDLKGP